MSKVDKTVEQLMDMVAALRDDLDVVFMEEKGMRLRQYVEVLREINRQSVVEDIMSSSASHIDFQRAKRRIDFHRDEETQRFILGICGER